MALERGAGALDEWKGGWPLPLVAAVGIAVFNMPTNSLGALFGPLEEDLGWTRAEAASGLTAMSAAAIFAIPLVGRLVDRLGARRIALPGVLLFAAAFAMLSLPRSPIWQWWVAWLILGVAIAGVSPAVWTAAVTTRFDKSRGLALSVTLSGAGIGTIVAPLLTNWLVETQGWRITYMAMAGIFCAVLLPLVYFLFLDLTDVRTRTARGRADRSLRTGPAMSILDMMRNTTFVRLVLATILVAFSILALVVHFIPILTTSGLAKTQAAEAAALIGVGSICGRIVAGMLLDRLHGPYVGGGAFLLPAIVSLSLLHWSDGGNMVFVIALLLGFSLGSEIDVVAYLTSRYVGVRNFGSSFGISVSALAVATGLGPLTGGLIYDLTGSYRYLLVGTVPLCVLAALLVVTLGTYAEQDDVEAGGSADDSGRMPAGVT